MEPLRGGSLQSRSRSNPSASSRAQAQQPDDTITDKPSTSDGVDKKTLGIIAILVFVALVVIANESSLVPGVRLYILQNSAQHSAGRSSLKWFLGEAVHVDGQELWQGQPVLSRTYKVHGVRVQALQVDAPGAGFTTPTFLLLHGARFSSHTWRDLGILHALANHSARVIAVDLPGHGDTKGFISNVPGERAEFLRELIRQVDAQKLILVSPSMSGLYAFPYLERHAADIAAWVAAVPIGLSDWRGSSSLEQADAILALDATAVYDEQDALRDEARALAKLFPLLREAIVKGARHASYVDEPELFTSVLVGVLERLRQKKTA